MKKLVLLILLMICVVNITVPAFCSVKQNGIVSNEKPEDPKNEAPPKDPPK